MSISNLIWAGKSYHYLLFHKRVSCSILCSPPTCPTAFIFLGRIPWIVCAYVTLGHLWRLRERWRQLLTWKNKINPFTEEFTSFHRYSLNVFWMPTTVFTLRQKAKTLAISALSNTSLIAMTRSGGLKSHGINWKDKALWYCKSQASQLLHPVPSPFLLFHFNSFNFLTFTEYFCQINMKTWTLPFMNSTV